MVIIRNINHRPGCWNYHHDCAINEIHRLRALLSKNEFQVSKTHPETSKAISKKIGNKSQLRSILDHVRSTGMYGSTDKEGEHALSINHESYSGGRRTLVRKGYVKDSGEKRLTPSGNPAIVWVST
jgi:uncharacterized protein (UPF0128 family)